MRLINEKCCIEGRITPSAISSGLSFHYLLNSLHCLIFITIHSRDKEEWSMDFSMNKKETMIPYVLGYRYSLLENPFDIR